MVHGVMSEAVSNVTNQAFAVFEDVTNLSTEQDIFLYGYDHKDSLYIMKRAKETYRKMMVEGKQALAGIYGVTEATVRNQEVAEYDNVAFISTDEGNIFYAHEVALIVPGAYVKEISLGVIEALLGSYMLITPEYFASNGKVSAAELIVPTNAVGKNKRTPVMWSTTTVSDKYITFGGEPNFAAIKEVFPAVEETDNPARFVCFGVKDKDTKSLNFVYNRNNKGYRGTIPEYAIMAPLIAVIEEYTPEIAEKPVTVNGVNIPPLMPESTEDVGKKKSAAAALLGLK